MVYQEKPMPRKPLLVLAIALAACVAAYGQSLGDIARVNREKQTSATPNAKPATITNDDLGQDAPAKNASRPAGTASSKPIRKAAQEGDIDPRAAAQWKRQIVAQQDKIATLQGRVDEINATLHPPGSAQFNGPYNRYQTAQMDRLANLQLQLDEQKKKLAEMQEEARQAGMHTTVYDP
jgi:hypothetical protein